MELSPQGVPPTRSSPVCMCDVYILLRVLLLVCVVCIFCWKYSLCIYITNRWWDRKVGHMLASVVGWKTYLLMSMRSVSMFTCVIACQYCDELGKRTMHLQWRYLVGWTSWLYTDVGGWIKYISRLGIHSANAYEDHIMWSFTLFVFINVFIAWIISHVYVWVIPGVIL